MSGLRRFLLLGSLVIFAFASAASAVAGVTIEQSQNGYVKVVAECSGNDCTSSVKVTSTQDQFQSFQRNTVTTSNGEVHQKNDDWPTRHGTDGQARISWDMRGGTCYIRYTENYSRVYKYSTETACDNGALTIGGLRRGRMYRFQIKQDNGDWIRTTRVIAR